MMQALEECSVLDNTLVIFTSDNGIPYPGAKTNLYDPGMMEPFLISSPLSRCSWGQRSNALVSTTDIVPTILDWFGLPFPNYTLPGMPRRVTLHGRSLLPLLNEEHHLNADWDEVYLFMYFTSITLLSLLHDLSRQLSSDMTTAKPVKHIMHM